MSSLLQGGKARNIMGGLSMECGAQGQVEAIVARFTARRNDECETPFLSIE